MLSIFYQKNIPPVTAWPDNFGGQSPACPSHPADVFSQTAGITLGFLRPLAQRSWEGLETHLAMHKRHTYPTYPHGKVKRMKPPNQGIPKKLSSNKANTTFFSKVPTHRTWFPLRQTSNSDQRLRSGQRARPIFDTLQKRLTLFDWNIQQFLAKRCYK